MAKDHKYHRSRIEAETSLPVDQVLKLAEEVIETQKGFRFLGRNKNSIGVVHKGWTGFTLMEFTVEATPAGERTRLVTQLQSYMTERATVFYLPLGPRTISSYRPYRGYLRALEQVILAADPSANAVLVEMGDGIFDGVVASHAPPSQPALVSEARALSAPAPATAPAPAPALSIPSIDTHRAAELVVDPAATQQQLADIAASYPQLWPYVRVHPACYTGLADWIDHASASRSRLGRV